MQLSSFLILFATVVTSAFHMSTVSAIPYGSKEFCDPTLFNKPNSKNVDRHSTETRNIARASLHCLCQINLAKRVGPTREEWASMVNADTDGGLKRLFLIMLEKKEWQYKKPKDVIPGVIWEILQDPDARKGWEKGVRARLFVALSKGTLRTGPFESGGKC
ncbi:hypothetical protein BC835DRAFT_1304244 [Cytidiella melzeri]|nr:hypothetical protein BC835DRAFT_1304244 [Cytidiella melzeri]